MAGSPLAAVPSVSTTAGVKGSFPARRPSMVRGRTGQKSIWGPNRCGGSL